MSLRGRTYPYFASIGRLVTHAFMLASTVSLQSTVWPVLGTSMKVFGPAALSKSLRANAMGTTDRRRRGETPNRRFDGRDTIDGPGRMSFISIRTGNIQYCAAATSLAALKALSRIRALTGWFAATETATAVPSDFADDHDGLVSASKLLRFDERGVPIQQQSHLARRACGTSVSAIIDREKSGAVRGQLGQPLRFADKRAAVAMEEQV